MNDEQKRILEIERADRAEAALKNPVVAEALDLIERELIDAWELAPPRDVEFREKCWSMYICARKFRNTLKSVMETGQMAKMQLEEKRRFKLFGGR